MRLFFPLFGDDVFISYSRKDGSLYAAGLADKLTQKPKGLSCFIDKLGAEPNHDLPESLKKKIRNCTVFVIVGTEKAAQSKFVEKEIIEFKKTGRTFLVIDFDGNVDKALWYDHIPGLPAEPEKNVQALETGDPSQNVVNFVKKSFNYIRRNQYTFAMFVGALVMFAVLTGAGYGSYRFAMNQADTARQLADEQTKRAEDATKKANEAEQRAEKQEEIARTKEIEARNATKRADDAGNLADEKTALADQKTGEAIKANNLAEEKILLAQAAENRRKLAEAEAAKQERIAFSREQASNSVSLLPFDPEQSLLIAGRAYRAAKTPQAEFALRRSFFDSRIKTILKGHTGAVLDAYFSESGRFAVTMSSDKTLKIWNTQTGDEINTLKGEGEFEQAFFSPDENYVAVADRSTIGSVQLWTWQGKPKHIRLSPPPEHCPKFISRSCPVETIAFSPDGRFIAGGGGGYLWVWEIETRKLETFIREAGFIHTQIMFDPTGKYILSSTNEKGAFLWDWKAKQSAPKPVFLDSLGLVTHVAFSPSGEYLLQASMTTGMSPYQVSENEIWVWSTRQFVDLPDYETPNKPDDDDEDAAEKPDVDPSEDSDDDDMPTEPGDDTPAEKEELGAKKNKAPLIKLKSRTGLISDAKFSPNNEMIAVTGKDGTAVLLDVSLLDIISVYGNAALGELQGREIRPTVLRGHTAWIRNAAFSPDSEYLVTSSDDGTARLWRTKTTTTALQELASIGGLEVQSLAIFRGHIGGVRSAQFSADGKFVITAGEDGTARIWNAAMDNMVREFDFIASASFSPTGKMIATSSSNSNVPVQIWDDWKNKANDKLPIAELEEERGSYFRNPIFSNDENFVAAMSTGSVAIWNWKSEKNRRKPTLLNIKSPEEIKSIAFSSDAESRYLLTAGGTYSRNLLPGEGVLRIWDRKQEESENNPIVLKLSDARVQAPVTNAVFSKDNKFIVSSQYPFVCVWEWQSETARKNPLILEDRAPGLVEQVAISPDSKYIAAIVGSFVNIWDWRSEQGRKNPIHLRYLSDFEISSVSFAPDGKMLLLSTDDGAISLWDAATGLYISTVGTFNAGSSPKAAFSSDGRYIIVTGISGSGTKDAAKVFYCELCADIENIFTLFPKYVSPQSMVLRQTDWK